MKKLVMFLLIVAAVACQNPEDSAKTPNADTTPNYQEDNVLNTPPGGTSPDTSSAGRRAASPVDTSGQ